MAEGSVDYLFTKQKELWVILMSTITMLYNFVFCLLSFVYIWNEYKKLTMTNKNHLFVSQFSNTVIKYFCHIFLKLFKLDCYSALYNNTL